MAVRGKAQRGRRRRNMKKKGPSNKSLNKKIKHIENNLMELKYVDNIESNITAVPAGVFFYISAIAQGDTASTRTGNVINPTSLLVRQTFFAQDNSLVASLIRCIVFWDRQPNGANPVLVGASTTQSLLDTGVITEPINAPRNFNTIDRYKILYDKTHVINPQVVKGTTPASGAVTTYCAMQKHVSFRINLNRIIKYNNTTAVIAAAASNALHIAYWTDTTITQQPDYSAGYRLYYRDS